MGGDGNICLLSVRCRAFVIAKGDIGTNFSRRKSPIAKMKIHIRMPFVMLDKMSFSPPDVVCITSDEADPSDRMM